jgi:hypothetical protein
MLANSKVGDAYGSRIVTSLKTTFGVEDLQLIGNGGEHLKNNHDMNSILDLDDLREKVLYLWRYHQKNILSHKFSPVFYYQHPLLRTNQHILKIMNENETFDNIVRARPSCIIGLDNEHLSREMIHNVNLKYNEKFRNYQGGFDKLKRPECYMLTNTVRHWDEHHQFFCDKAFYTYAFKQINKRLYVYPSHYVGQYGAYDAIRHVYTKSGLFPHLVKENSILASRQFSLDHIEKARMKIQSQFREKHQIPSDATLIFLAPGNTVEENTYTLDAFRRGYNEFILKNSYPTSLSHHSPPKNMFKLVISVNKGTKSEEFVREFIKSSQYETDVIVVTNNENEHFDAICSSDFGVVYNGQLVSSAAALHLNFFTMQNMNDLHYFWHTWENRWLADINVNADRPAIKEMAAGEFWVGKICEELR